MFKLFSKMKKEAEELEMKTETLKTETEEEPKPVRAVIDGLLYDTSKAKIKATFLVCNAVKDLSQYCEADLYITKSGRYFCEQYGNIIPLNEHELKYLLEHYPDLYQEIFGKVEEA